ncbi:mersacidin/lichenicidin family type 2 lantibiotic [Hyalangium versicolor]|uniref:mersacidin/lichenicidin family type 2 lantibiotic n=1 Tax=Hyalangium versicolor TaxID=2861190 RepID=UPI001CCE1508|nr:mersacidin/lichenicidin family type 2 lantibiotic [Hyalangium versicolor]
MNTAMIVQAWKDPEYRASLPLEQRAALPENPSGVPLTELEESELSEITGGRPLPVTCPELCCFLSINCLSLTLVCRDLDS